MYLMLLQWLVLSSSYQTPKLGLSVVVAMIIIYNVKKGLDWFFMGGTFSAQPLIINLSVMIETLRTTLVDYG